MKIGILTGGGDCSGLNAVLRGAVRTAISRYNSEIIGFLYGFKGLIENKTRHLGWYEVSGILPRGGTIIGTVHRNILRRPICRRKTDAISAPRPC